MAFNNGFPVGYPQVPQAYPQYFPQYQPQQQPQQTFTPPTIHAEIVQVENEQAAANYPVGAGASQMMIAKDDSAIYVKTATASGYTIVAYLRRAESEEQQPEYVTRAELEKRLASILEAMEGKHNEPV